MGKPNFHSHIQTIEGSGANELKHRSGEPTTEGFKVLRMVRSDRGVARGERGVKAVKAAKGGKVGRPPVYNGMHRIIMRGALKQYGLTGAQTYLAKERKLDVSLTVLRSVAKEFGVEFERGRRPSAA